MNAEDLSVLQGVDDLIAGSNLGPAIEATKRKARPRPAEPPTVSWIERDEDGNVKAKRPAIDRKRSGQG